MAVHVKVAAVGLTDVRKALRLVAPDLARRLTLNVRREATGIATAARAKFPRGETGAGAAGFKVERISSRASGVGFSGGYRVVNRTREGTILEFAGSASSGTTAQGRSLIAGLNARHGPPGRFLWSTWDEKAEGVKQRIDGVVRDAERDLQARLNAAGRRP